MWSSGPRIIPISSWPRVRRWLNACSVATASSVDTWANARSSLEALTRTTGNARLAQQVVVAVGRVGLGEIAAGEDYARSMLVQQHVDVVGF